MTPAQVESGVRQILQTVLKRPIRDGEQVSAEHEPNWDSLQHVEVLLAVEGAFDIRFDEDEMAQLDSLARLVQSVKRHRAP